jgi:hypothetical protein
VLIRLTAYTRGEFPLGIELTSPLYSNVEPERPTASSAANASLQDELRATQERRRHNPIWTTAPQSLFGEPLDVDLINTSDVDGYGPVLDMRQHHLNIDSPPYTPREAIQSALDIIFAEVQQVVSNFTMKSSISEYPAILDVGIGYPSECIAILYELVSSPGPSQPVSG